MGDSARNPSSAALIKTSSSLQAFGRDRLLALFAISLAAGNPSAFAQLTWNNAGPTNNWSTADANWLPGNIVWTQNESALFGSTGETITVTTANIFNDLTFNSTGYVIADGAGSLALGADQSSTITVTTAGQSVTLSEVLLNNGAGPSTLTKAGAGTLTLTNTANSYSGGTTISAGFVNAGNVGASGVGTLGSGAVSIASGAGLTLNSATGDVFYNNSFSGAGALTLNTGAGSESLVLNGNLTGYTGAMEITGGGKGVLTAGSGSPGTGATINVASNATLYVVDGINVSRALTLNGGNTGESLGQLRIESNSTYSGNITLAGNFTDGFDSTIGSNNMGTITGAIGESGGARTLSKGGGGTIVFTGTGTYTGGTFIRDGTLQVGNGGTTGTLGSGEVFNAATLAFNRSDAVTLSNAVNGGGALLQQGTGTLILTGTNGYTGTTNISAGTLQIGNGGTTGTIGSGAITNNGALAFNRSDAVTLGNAVNGGGALLQQGTGTLTLTGANGYTGTTNISAGTLQIGNGGTTGTIGSGAITNNSALTFNRSDTLTLSSAINGTGVIAQVGGGTVNLSGANSARTLFIASGGGIVDLGAGNLTLSNNGAAAVQAAGGTINATGGGQIVLGSSGGSGNGLDFGTTNGTTLTINAVISGATDLDFYNTENGSGVVVLTGQNTYTGPTNIQSGVVSVSTLGNAGANGNLGTNASVRLGLANISNATLRYTGAGETTDRVLTLVGGSAGQTLEQSGANGNFKITGNVGNAGASTTLTLQGSTAGTGELGGIIADNSGANKTSIAKSGTGTWTLSGANTYTGTTNVSGGTLAVSGNISGSTAINVTAGTLLLFASDAVNNAAAALTLGSNGAGTSGTVRLAGNNLTERFGALTLSFSSTLDFGTGTGGQELLFASVGTHTPGSTLSILNWSGSANTLGNSTTDRLLFSGNASEFTSKYAQSDVSFGGFAPGYQAISYEGGYEITAVPEPATTALLSALGLLGMVAYRERQRLWQIFAKS